MIVMAPRRSIRVPAGPRERRRSERRPRRCAVTAPPAGGLVGVWGSAAEWRGRAPGARSRADVAAAPTRDVELPWQGAQARVSVQRRPGTREDRTRGRAARPSPDRAAGRNEGAAGAGTRGRAARPSPDRAATRNHPRRGAGTRGRAARRSPDRAAARNEGGGGAPGPGAQRPGPRRIAPPRGTTRGGAPGPGAERPSPRRTAQPRGTTRGGAPGPARPSGQALAGSRSRGTATPRGGTPRRTPQPPRPRRTRSARDEAPRNAATRPPMTQHAPLTATGPAQSRAREPKAFSARALLTSSRPCRASRRRRRPTPCRAPRRRSPRW